MSTIRSEPAQDGGVTEPSHLAISARIARNQLVGAECTALTGGRPDEDGVAECGDIDRIGRAAYVQIGLSVVAVALSFGELVERVAGMSFDAERFRIEVHDPGDRLAMTSTEVAITLADVIPQYPDLRDPTHRFVVVARETEVLLGRVESSSDGGYRTHDDKPWTTSSSLDSRLSRALVNLVPTATSILDPCCGAGSIVVEAASLGLDAFAVDWKPAMVGMTRENLAHFGYAATVTRADSRVHDQPADAIVTDLPYGHAIEADEPTIRAILERGVELAPEAVYVARADITLWLRAAGYAEIDVCTVRKRAGFTRWVHVARRSVERPGRSPG
jgi:tRNA G10  N-methylase Trm11